MNQTIDREYARAVFNRQRAVFKESMQQFSAVQREIELLLVRGASDPEARRKVAGIEGEIQRSGVEWDLQQIRQAEGAFARLESDFSRRFSVEAPAAHEQLAITKTPAKKTRIFV